jgi:hypothetical protein
MSKFSAWFCRRCRQPIYDCNCEEPDFVAPMIEFFLRKEIPPQDHPWFDEEKKDKVSTRGRRGVTLL